MLYRRLVSRWIAALLALLAPLAPTALALPAPSFVVTNTNDSGVGSLREAITQGNLTGGTTITFDPAVFTEATPGTIQLQSDLPPLEGNYIILGPATKAVVIRGRHFGGAIRIFRVPAGRSATIGQLTFATGRVVGTDGASGPAPTAGGDALGAAISNSGAVVVGNCLFSDCRVDGGSGGGAQGGGAVNGAAAGQGAGGAIASNGTSLLVRGCTFVGCFAMGGSGGNASFNSTGNGGAAGPGRGGAIAVLAGTASVEICSFLDSVAFGGFGGGGGGLGAPGGDAEGGAIYAGVPMTVTSCTIVGGVPAGGNYNCTGGLGGGGAVGGAASGVGRGGGIRAVGAVTLSNTIVQGNVAGVFFQGSAPADVFGPFSSQGFNLIGTGEGATGIAEATDRAGTNFALLDAKLGPLAETGGLTPTFRLLRGSPAVDRGSSFALSTDQREFGRTADLDDAIYPNAAGGDGTDIGAWEAQTPPNDAPVANGGSVGGVAGVAFSGQALGGSDLDGDTLTYALAAGSTLPGTLVLNSNGTLTGTVPAALEVTASYEVSDGLATSAPGSFTIRVSEAQTFVVTTTIDNSTDTDGLISLREAVNYANGTGTAQTITFDPTVFATAQTITLANANGGVLSITVDLDLTGPAAGVTVSGGGETNLFQIFSAGPVNLRNLTLAHAGISDSAVIVYSGTVTLSGCTLRDNAAADFVEGGAIANYGGTLTLVNCTLTRNSADGENSDGGGAIYQLSGALSVLNCTIAGNDAGPNQGGALFIEGGTAQIGNSIISGNTAASGTDLSDASAAGTITSLGFNLLGDTTGATFTAAATDLVNTAPLFDTDGLAFNGGPTQTIALQPTSPARDKGQALGGVTTDQRGFPRPFDNPASTNATGGDGSDIGAVEGQAAPDIAVLGGAGVDLRNGEGSFGFGNQDVGLVTLSSLLIKNKGGSTLTFSSVSFSGTDAADFTVTQLPLQSVAAGESTVVEISFAPRSIGAKGALLTLASNDPDEPAFTFSVSGTAVDTVTAPGTITAPGSGAPSFAMVSVTFTLPEAALAGSVVLTFDNGTAFPTTLPTANETAGEHTVTIDTAALGMNPGVYDLTLSYQDAAAHPAASTTKENIVIRPPNAASVKFLAIGDAAPDAGVLGADGPPVGATLTSFGVPCVDDAGNVSFLAKWTSPTTKGSGLFYNATSILILGGEAEPLVGPKIKTLSDPVGSAGNVALLATLSGVPKASAAVVMTNATAGRTPQVIAQAGTVAPITDGTQPATGAKFKAFKGVAIVGSSVGFLATLTGGTGTERASGANDTGLWLKNHTDPVKLLLREGQTVGTRTIKTLTSFASGAGSPGQGRGWLTQPYGTEMLAHVTFTDKTQAVLTVIAGGAVTINSATAEPVAGVAGATFASYSFPTANNNYATAFLASMKVGTGGVTKATARAIFASGTNDYTLLARVGSPAGATGATFSVLKDPVLSDDGGVAFPATLKGGGLKGIATATLWWQPSGGEPGIIAQGGQPAGDLPGSQWKAFTSLAIADNRGPVFSGTLVPGKGGVTKASAMGVWACDFTGEPRLLFRTGDPIDVGAAEPKTVKSFMLLKASVGSTGVSRSFNDDAQVVWLATFTDKSQAIVVTEVP